MMSDVLIYDFLVIGINVNSPKIIILMLLEQEFRLLQEKALKILLKISTNKMFKTMYIISINRRNNESKEEL